MRRVLRASLVGALTLTLCVDPATACHFLRSRWGGSGGYGWGGDYCPAPADYAGPCSGVVISGDGCCTYDGYGAEDYVDSCCDSGTIIDSGEPIYHDVQPAPLEPTPSESSTFKPSEEERPSLPADPMPERPEAPADDELVAPPSQPAVPPTTQPATPPADTPVTPPADTNDDLFGPIDPPATPPATSTPSTPPASTPQTPATPPQTPPAAADPMDDFFGDEPAQPADAGALPDQPATPPADSTPPASTPATPPSEPADDDLFGDLSSEPAPSQPATPAADAETGDADLGGFDFNEDPAPPANDAAPAETGEESAEEVDMFDFGAILREPGGFSSNEVRTWVDNTGKYSCNGRLIRFVDGQVRLLKDNGRTTTLPLYRLSENDLEFVHRQASAKQAEVIGHTAAVATTPLLAN